MIRVGLAGYGLAGARFHAPLIRACDRMELAAVLTSKPVECAVSSVAELIDRSDLIVVATPNATHHAIAKAALEADRHVLVDKPFTTSVAQADELIALAAARGRRLTVFQNRRWDGDFLTVQSILPGLGALRLFEAHWDRFRLYIRDSWKEVPDDGSGLLADLGPHLIDQALVLFGKPEAIHADLESQREGAQVDDYFVLTLHYGAMRAVLTASTMVAQPRPRFALHGSGGSFVKFGLDPQEQQFSHGLTPASEGFGEDELSGRLTLPDGSMKELPTERGWYLNFYSRLADAILDGCAVPVEPADAREVMRIIEAARVSASEGRRISL